ncbi:hypothetical protein [Rhodococcus olei]|uniref:hypothetical protein n=1 Tax=Rhodococcus olei TaxID=2161675 RepID=UPI0031ECB8F6
MTRIAWWLDSAASIGWSVTLVTAFAVHTIATGRVLWPHRRQRTRSVEDIEFCP